MKKGLLILAVIVVCAFPLIGSYNSIAAAREGVDASFHNIETQLQRRGDLIPNLVETVKGYAAHETEIMSNIAEARARLAGASTPGELADADAELSGALSRLLVVVENYPDLKANQNFIALMDELAGTENRIAVARTDYNEAVRSFNTMLVRFPRNIIAGIFGFEKADYFQAEAEAGKVPTVNF
jgi:LemA protein